MNRSRTVGVERSARLRPHCGSAARAKVNGRAVVRFACAPKPRVIGINLKRRDRVVDVFPATQILAVDDKPQIGAVAQVAHVLQCRCVAWRHQRHVQLAAPGNSKVEQSWLRCKRGIGKDARSRFATNTNQTTNARDGEHKKEKHQTHHWRHHHAAIEPPGRDRCTLQQESPYCRRLTGRRRSERVEQRAAQCRGNKVSNRR